MSDSIKHATSISQAASSFGQRGEVLAQELRGRPKGYLEHFDGHPHIDAVFFGMEAEAAKVVRLKFIQKGKTADSLELIPVIKECPGDCPKDQKRIAFCIGECNIITKPETNPMNPIFIGARPDEDVIRDLIEREEMADKYVGGPIDIVRIDRKGSHWAFNAEGTCSPDEKKPSIPAHKKRGSSAK